MAKLIDAAGYLFHKYNPDGTLASSWHPWFQDGQNQLPIQEDSTALVIWALWHHFVLYRDIEFIKPFYRPLIKRAADFMSQYPRPANRAAGPFLRSVGRAPGNLQPLPSAPFLAA